MRCARLIQPRKNYCVVMCVEVDNCNDSCGRGEINHSVFEKAAEEGSGWDDRYRCISMDEQSRLLKQMKSELRSQKPLSSSAGGWSGDMVR